MSAVAGKAPTRPARARKAAPKAAAPSPPPVKYWAAIGVALVAAEAFFLAKWALGDNWERVDSGPDDPSEAMQVALVSLQVVFTLATIFTFYWFLVRPWRREGRISSDGLICIGLLLVAPFDMLANYGNTWFTYNSYLVNFGSVMAELPGTTSFRGPGANEAFPWLIVPTAYVTGFMWLALVINWQMSRIKGRFPSFGPGRMIGCAYVMCIFGDFLIEGIIFMLAGSWAYGGGHLNINAGHYYQFPAHELAFGGAVFCGITCLRYFRNDKGETLAERGAERLRWSRNRTNLARMFAVSGAVWVIFLFTYHLPSGIVALNSSQWPEDIEKRSYFTNNICAEDTGRPCGGKIRNPGPGE